ncbi:hypothetical protein [Sphingomonas sp.]|uniref:hypothetical protein n=1 Tax=Sphingomonas sp. TaxID=28214 RepID=UPI002FDA8435
MKFNASSPTTFGAARQKCQLDNSKQLMSNDGYRDGSTHLDRSILSALLPDEWKEWQWQLFQELPL